MQYLLDSNAVIAMLRDSHSAPAARARRESLGEVGLSAVVLYELYYGGFKRGARYLRLVDALRFPVLDFDRNDARCAGEIRAALTAAGRMIGPYDVLIAGQAAARGLILVTHNVRELARVPGLRIEDWET